MTSTISQERPKFERLHFVVGQEDREAVSTIDHLHAQGVQRIASCNGNTNKLFGALNEEIVDLLIYDADLLGDSFVEVMQNVRRKAQGRNPFVVIVATANDSDPDTVSKMVRAGVDDFIRKPVSNARLFESMSKFMRRRKSFAVSYDYVGPNTAVEGSALESPSPLNPIIRVPNTMRSRAVENMAEADLESMIESAVANLHDKLLLSFGGELNLLAMRVATIYGGARDLPDIAETVRDALRRMELVADALRERSRGTHYERLGDLATMMIALVQRLLRMTIFRATVDVQLLAKLAEAIHNALVVDRDSEKIVRDIAETISGYKPKQ